MTLEAQPHEAVTNTNSVVYVPGQLVPAGNFAYDTGALTIFYGLDSTHFANNILVTNCQFLSADRSIVMPNYVSNVMITSCNFAPIGGTDTWGHINTYTNQTGIYYEVGIEVRDGGSYNLGVIGNTYNGNPLITTTNTNSAAPVTAGEFADMTNASEWLAADGLVYFQQAGNVVIARNLITNNQYEAIQLNAGPASVAGNTFYTLVNVPACCALAGEINSYGLPGTSGLDNSFTFVGNWVYGDRLGHRMGNNQLSTVVNFSGNWLNLSPVITGFASETGPGAAVNLQFCPAANVCGNTLVAGGNGVYFSGTNNSALILNNNFTAAAYRGIGYASVGASLSTAQIFGNTLGQGVSFHVQLPYTNSFGWFIGNNTYVDTNANNISLFTDPASSAIHIFN